MPWSRELRKAFGSVAEVYQASRPDYPENMIADLLKYSGLECQGLVLDVGCGTGIASRQFAAHGLDVVGIDISEEMLSIARKTTVSKTSVYCSASFETAALQEGSYDMIVSAQAWHWANPRTKYARAHSLLFPNGTLAVFWSFEEDSSKWSSTLETLCKKYCSSYQPTTAAQELDRNLREMKQSGLFEGIVNRTYKRTLNYTKDRLKQLLDSYSYIAVLSMNKKKRFFQEVDELLASEADPMKILFRTVLVTGKKA